MGWFWNTPSGNSDPNDPFHRLDPDIRDYLLRESPLKPPPSNTSSSSTSQTETPPPPNPSKFGTRYADIWDQYQPHSTTTASTSAQQQLADIIAAYKWRKGAIGRAALENCTDEQWELYECYRRGSVKERLTACSSKRRRLGECYVAQAGFLKALGYMSDFSRDPEVDEKIQMHADRLYQEQVAQDEAAAAAKGGEKGKDAE